MSFEMWVLLGSVAVQVVGVILARNLTNYRIEQLEKKVDKHNSVIERTYKIEGHIRELTGDVDEIKGKIC